MSEPVVDIHTLQQDNHNFNKGTTAGKQLMEKSFRELGAGRSILLDKDGRIIAGNKSQLAAIEAGITKVRVIETTGDELVAVKRTDVSLDDKKGRELALADNVTTQINLSWDQAELAAVGEDIPELNVADWGLDPKDLPINTADETDEQAIERKRKEFEDKMAAGELDEDDPEYQAFLEKFEAKKTTDDCYTPEIVYEAVADWVANEYGLNRANFVRPFYPGGDYQKERYSKDSVVVDNPPFSILAEIIDWYNAQGIRYFLFGPQLTLLGTTVNRCATLPVGVQITYANGANVNTSFATNLEPDDIVLRADPVLYEKVNNANLENLKESKREMPRYSYDPHVLMSPILHQFSRYGIPFTVRKEQCYPISELDSQKGSGKAIFGKGYLISESLLAEREKAEREKAEREKAERENYTSWELSDREREIIKSLK